LVFAWQTFTS